MGLLGFVCDLITSTPDRVDKFKRDANKRLDREERKLRYEEESGRYSDERNRRKREALNRARDRFK